MISFHSEASPERKAPWTLRFSEEQSGRQGEPEKTIREQYDFKRE